MTHITRGMHSYYTAILSHVLFFLLFLVCIIQEVFLLYHDLCGSFSHLTNLAICNIKEYIFHTTPKVYGSNHPTNAVQYNASIFYTTSNRQSPSQLPLEGCYLSAEQSLSFCSLGIFLYTEIIPPEGCSF